MTRLSVTVPFHDDEHSDSFMSRVAAANGDTLSIFIRNMGLDHRGLANWDDKCFERAAYLAGVDKSLLISRAVRNEERGLAVAGHYIPSTRIRRFAFNYCPRCVDLDRESGTGVRGCRPYGRLIWQMDFITCCPAHGIALMSANEERDPSLRCDFSRQIAEVSGAEEPLCRAPSDFELYAGNRVLGRSGAAAPFLDQHPLHVVVGICEAVGIVENHGMNIRKYELSDEAFFQIRERGFDVLSGNDGCFREYITTLANAARERAVWNSSGGRVYGSVYKDLCKLVHEDYDPLRRTIREISVERLPLGPEDDLFGPLPHRRWHSVSSAAKEFHISPSTLSKLLWTGGIIDDGMRGKSPYATMIEADRMSEFMKSYRSCLDPVGAMEYLAVPPDCWEHVLERSGIRPLALRPSSSRRVPLYAIADLDGFIAHLAGGRAIEPTGSHSACHVDVVAAREVGKCRLVDVIDLLASGALQNVTRTDAASGLAAIYVDPEEVAVKAAGLSGRTVAFNQLPGMLQFVPDGLPRLVSAGYLSTSSPLENDTDIRSADFMAWSIELFRERYKTLSNLAHFMGLEPRHLRRQLADAGIEPILNDRQPGRTFYDVREVERFDAEVLIR